MTELLTDDELEALFAEAAAVAPEPAPCVLPWEDELDARRPRWTRTRTARWLPAVAAVAVALVAGSKLLDDRSPGDPTTASAPQSATTVVATGGGDDVQQSAGAPNGGQAYDPGTGDRTPAATGSGAAGGATAPPAPLDDRARADAVAPTAPLAPARVVKTGSLDLRVAEGAYQPTVDRITSLAQGAGGYIASTQTTDLGDHPRGAITVRVPSAGYEQLLTAVAQLGDVQAESSTGQDVTAQYTDLESRLVAATQARDQLVTILSGANTIPDILSVQDRLNVANQQVEELEGQRRLLADQSDYGTLTVDVSEPGAAPPAPVQVTPPGDGGVSGAWEQAKAGFGDAIEWFVARSGKALVVTVVALLAVAIARLGFVRLRRARL